MSAQPRLTIVPLSFRQASAFIANHHRHNKPPRGCKFAIGVCDETGSSLRATGMARVRELPARKGWADSSVALRALRDPVGNGGVPRVLWRAGDPLPNEEGAA